MSLHLLHPTHITPLEVWDVEVEVDTPGQRYAPLYRCDAGGLPRAMVDLVRRLLAGRARRTRVNALVEGPSFSRIFLAGGGPTAAVAVALREAGLVAAALPMPSTAGLRGLHRLLACADGEVPSSRRPSCWRVIDMGQTAIKGAQGHARWRLARDHRRAPLLDALPGDLDDDARRAVEDTTLCVLAEGLQGAGVTAGLPVPVGLAIAMPCELQAIGQRIVPGGCSYVWRDGDETLLPRLLAAAGLSDRPCFVANDAVAAAAAAPARAGDAALVLTLGLGVGAAVVVGTRGERWAKKHPPDVARGLL